MDFQGRQILASDFMEFFENYEQAFLNNVKQIQPNISNSELRLYTSIIQNLLIKDFTAEKFIQICKNLSVNNFNQATLSYALLKLSIDFSNFLMENNYLAQNNTFLNNAFYELLNITNTTKIQELTHNNEKNETDNIKTQEVKEEKQIEKINIQEPVKAQELSAGNGFVLRENFIDSFTKIYNMGMEIEFLNLYKGVPVKSKGKVLGIDEDTITIRTDTMQILAMQEEKMAFIVANDYINKNVSASLLLPNAIAKMVSLNNFKTQEHMHALKRKYPRVHPNKFTKVELLNKEGIVVAGKLFDISEGGIGVVSADDSNFKNGEEINAKFELFMPNNPSDAIVLDLNFKLIVKLNQSGVFRYCMEILPNQNNVDKIAEFSRQRVDDTLKELKNVLKTYEK